MQVDLGVGYLHDSIDEVEQIDVPGPLVLSTGVTTDSAIPFTPKWSVNFGIGYISDPIAYGLQLMPHVDFFYKSPQFFDAQNTPEIAQLEDVTQLNLSLAIEYQAGDWRLIASGKNLTDEVYSIGGNSALSVGSGHAEAVFVRGRKWFISFAHNFYVLTPLGASPVLHWPVPAICGIGLFLRIRLYSLAHHAEAAFLKGEIDRPIVGEIDQSSLRGRDAICVSKNGLVKDFPPLFRERLPIKRDAEACGVEFPCMRAGGIHPARQGRRYRAIPSGSQYAP